MFLVNSADNIFQQTTYIFSDFFPELGFNKY